MSSYNEKRSQGTRSVGEFAVTPEFVTAIAQEYAEHGRTAFEALRLADPARFLMLTLTVATDDRYIAAWDEADKLAAQ